MTNNHIFFEVYKERMLSALKELESSINSIHMLRNKLLARFESKFECRDERYENTDIILASIENLLSALSNKLDTIVYFYEMMIILEKVVRSLNTIKDDIDEFLPSLDLALDNILNSLIEIRSILRIDNKPIDGLCKDLESIQLD